MFSRFRSPDSQTPAASYAGRTPWRLTAAATMAMMLAAGVAGCKPATDGRPAAPAASAAQAPVVPPIAVNQSSAPAAPLVTGLPDFTPLVERVGPSVVNIRTMEKVNTSRLGGGGTPEQQMEELLRKFFGVPLPDGHPRRGTPAPDGGEERPTGVGSGFILSADGYIMTNAHVVDGADDLIVTLPDKREFRAKVVGKDVRTDVAVVKIDGKDLPAVHIGKVDSLKVGQWVMAIGSPFGLENTVTAGIVSAMQRDTGDYLPFIQTDVAINPGNSGGPLINMQGEVVGINSQIYSRSGGFMGISFSIPIDEAVRIADQLRATGTVTRGRIGVQIGAVGKDVAESMGLGKEEGALVRGVEAGSPAEKAGVQPGDIITRFNGSPIARTSDLPRLVGETKPGTAATMTVLRNGSSKDLSITIAKSEDGATPRSLLGQNGDALPGAPAVKSLGLTVAEMSAQQRQQLRGKGGVLVQGVEPGSPAERAGLQQGDIIMAIGNQQVDNVPGFTAAVGKLPPNRSASLLFQRGEYAQFTMIRPAGR